MSSATIPPASFMGGSGGGVTGSYRQPPSSQPTNSNSNAYQNDFEPNPYLTDSEGNAIDASSLFMFTTVGYVGLHFVLRPLFRWGLRSLLMPAKSYYNDNDTKAKSKNKKLKSKSTSKILSETINVPNISNTNTNNDENENTDSNNNELNGEIDNENNDNNAQSATSSVSNLKKRKRKLLCNLASGPCGPYGEVVATFGALSGISAFAHPQNVLLYFGVLYPSYPFILRFIETLNDKKSKVTMGRVTRLAGKSLITTGGFALSMVFIGYYLQTVPFLNVIGLTFWDCVADMLISDGPDS